MPQKDDIEPSADKEYFDAMARVLVIFTASGLIFGAGIETLTGSISFSGKAISAVSIGAAVFLFFHASLYAYSAALSRFMPKERGRFAGYLTLIAAILISVCVMSVVVTSFFGVTFHAEISSLDGNAIEGSGDPD